MMMFRWTKLHGKVMIQDQQWSTLRMIFLALGILSVFSLFMTEGNTVYDYCRIVATIIAVTVYMACRDGVGEEGLIAGGKLFPWSEVKAWDYEERSKVVAVYFQVESQNEKKPDAYTTKELDFAKTDKYNLMKFMNMNLSRKYTRMKRK
jgi:hypothetical protein